MRGGSVKVACLSALLGLLLCVPAAQAKPQAQPRIIGGDAASQDEYPAQGALFEDGTFICGGTLVSNRYFLTAAHCVTTGTSVDDFHRFTVRLGSVNRNAGALFTFSALERNADYDPGTFDNDTALFTLSSPAPAADEPMRVIAASEDIFWAPTRQATLIGWGDTTRTGGDDSPTLLETTAPMRSDADCANAYRSSSVSSDFHPDTMVCAGDGATDTCFGDSGGPMMVSDGAFLVLAGITSWGGEVCGDPNAPGVYSRLGADGLNSWVRERVPMAGASASPRAAQPGQTVAFSAVTRNASLNPVTFTDLTWNFGDGSPSQTGAKVSHAYAKAGSYTARFDAATAGDDGDTAVAKVRVNVASPPPPPPPVVQPAPIAPQRPAKGSARILASGEPLVTHGRFHIRVNFTAGAPKGTAIIEVFRGKKKIATAKTTVRRSGSKRVTVKLSKAGRKLLRRSKSKRLKVTVRVRVKRQVLQTRKLTLRR
jgi:secreted trypsin-like serine protease